MQSSKFRVVRSIFNSRGRRLKSVAKNDMRRSLEFFAGELEQRQLLASFSYVSGLLTVQTTSADEQLTIISTSDSGCYTISTSSGLWTGSETDITASGSDLFVNQPFGLTSILVNDSNGTVANSSFNFGSSSANFVSSLTVNFTNTTSGLITLANSTSFVNGCNLNLATTGNQVSISNTISVCGTGGISLTGRNVVVTGNIAAAAGDITIYGNGGGVYQSGAFDGVCISGSSVNVNSTSGNIVIDGRGSSASNKYGVQINQSRIQTGSSGNITINGISGNGTGTIDGVYLYNGTVSTVDGLTSITGTSNGTGSDCFGITLEGGTANATVAASGNGGIAITGVSGAGNIREYGIHLKTRAAVTTNNGSITVVGTSRGSSSNSHGIYYVDSNVFGFMACGTQGCISLTGVTAYASAVGLYLGIGQVTTSGGPITLNANSVTMGSNARVNATLAGEVVFQRSGSGSFSLNNITANSLSLTSVTGAISVGGVSNITNNVNLAATGNISIATISSSGGNIQASTDQANSCISVTRNVITTGSGSISLTARNIAVTGNITSQAGDISIYGNGGGSYRAGTFSGVCISGTVANVNTTSGNIVIDGRGGGSSSDGVEIKGAKINAGAAGCVTITGLSGNLGSDTWGVYLDNTGSCITTSNGSITLNGTSCGTTTSGLGVYLERNSRIASTGIGNVSILGLVACGTDYSIGVRANASCITTTSGTLTINGTSCATGCNPLGVYALSSNVSATGSGNLNIIGRTIGGTNDSYGIFLNLSSLRANAGTFIMNGTTNGTANYAYGIAIQDSNITKSGSGNLTMTGISNNGILQPYGISITSLSSSTNISTVNGTLSLIGYSCGTFGDFERGIILSNRTNILTSGTSGSIYFDGRTANVTGSGLRFSTSTYSPSVSSNGRPINFVGTGFNLSPGVTINATLAGTVTINTIGQGVNLGGGDGLSDMGLTVAELNCITAGSLIIGNSTTGAIVNTADISRTNVTLGTNLTLVSANSITQSGGSLAVSGTANFVSSGSGVNGNITLNNTTNNFSTVTASGTNITINDTNGIAVSNITASGLTVSARGAITQSGVANVTGTANFTASGNITLGESNLFNTVLANGTNITIQESDDITLGLITANGDLTVSGVNTTSCISVTGPISASSSAGISIAGRNIQVNGNITTATGDITLYGHGGGVYQTGSFNGIDIGNDSAANVNVISGGGNIVLDGRGGGGSTYTGVYVNRACVTASGSGNVNITGVSGNGTNNAYGVKSFSSRITVANGSLNINGTSNGSGSAAIGAFLESSPAIAATGSGGIIVSGITLGGTTNARGIYVTGTPITTTTGLIRFNGTSCATGTGTSGIQLMSSANISATTSGNVDFTGSTPGNISNGTGINACASTALIYSNGGLITLTANTINLTGTVNATAAGNVLIQTLGAGVNLGGNDTSSNLGLTSTEIGRITANLLTIGNSTTGAIAITAAISRSNLTLISSNSITQTGGNLVVSGMANLVANGSITLNNSTNNFGTFAGCGTTVSVTDTNGIILGAITAANLTVSAGGAIIQSESVSVTGRSNFTGSSITFNQPTNQLGDVTSNGLLAIIAGNLTSLNATAGSVDISGSANITGLTTVDADLTQTGGTLNGLRVNGGTSNLSGGTFSGDANVVGGTLVSNTTIGSLTVANGATANLTGGSVLAATVSGGTLNSTNTTLGALAVDSGSATITGGLITGSVSGLGATSLTVTNYASNLVLGQLTTGSLNVNLTLGNLSQASGTYIVVSGNAILTTYGDITLGNTTNNFNDVSASGTNVTIADADALVLGTINATNLGVTTSGSVSQSGPATVSSASSFVASGGTITLNNPDNNFYSDVSLTANGGQVTIYNQNSTLLGMVQASSLTVNSTGSISQNGNISVPYGRSNFISCGTISLTNQTNEFQFVNLTGTDGAVVGNGSVYIGNVTLTNLTVNATNVIYLILSNVSLSGDLAMNSDGGIYQAGATSVLHVAGNTTAVCQSDLKLDYYGSNRFGGRITANAGGYVNLASNQNITLGEIICVDYLQVQSPNILLNSNINSGSTVDLSGDALVNANLSITANNADILVGSNLTGTGALSLASGTGNISIGYTDEVVDLDALTVASANLIQFGTNLTIDQLTINGGQVEMNQPLTGNFLLGANATANFTADVVSGNLTTSGTFISTANLPNLSVQGGTASLNGGSVTGLANVTGGTLVSSQSLGSLNVGATGTANISAGSIGTVTTGSTFILSGGTVGSLTVVDGVTNVTAGTISGTINVNGGCITLGGTQQGALNVNTTGAVEINTPVAGLTTVTGSCLTTVNANLAGGLTFNDSVGGITFNPALPISVGATIVTANNNWFIVPANTTLACLAQSNGTITLSGRVTGLTSVTGGTLNSNGLLGCLTLGASGSANLTGGSVSGDVSSAGSLTTAVSLLITSVSGGCVTVSAGITQISSGSGASVNLTGGTLWSDASLTSLTIGSSASAELNGGYISTANNSGYLWAGSCSFGSIVSSGTTDLRSGATVNGLTNVTAGNFNSLGTLTNLNITANATVNLDEGDQAVSVNGYVNSAGSLTTYLSLSNVTVSGGSVTVNGGTTNITTGSNAWACATSSGALISAANLTYLIVNGGSANLTTGSAGYANINDGSLISTANITGNLQITSCGTATINSGGIVGGTTRVAGDSALILNNAILSDLNIEGGSATVTAGAIGATTNAGLLTATSGTFASIESSGTIILSGSSIVSGLTRITGGTFTANAQLNGVSILAGIANLTGGSIGGNVASAGALITSVSLSNVTVSGGSVTVAGGTTNITSGSGAVANVTGGTLVTSANLTSLNVESTGTANVTGGTVTSVTTGATFNLTGGTVGTITETSGTSNISGGTVSGAININGGHITLGGTQQGALNVNTTGAVVIDTPVAGLTTVTNSCLTTVNANLAGGLTINAATGGVYFNPAVTISVENTTILGNVSTQVVPANTTLASLNQANGSVTNFGTVQGVTNITGGSLASNGVIFQLQVNGGAANLTGGFTVQAEVNSGSIASSGSITELRLEGGQANITGGNVCATYSNASLYVSGSAELNLLYVYSGNTTVTGLNTSISSVNLFGGVCNLGANQAGSVWVDGASADLFITQPVGSATIYRSNATLINANMIYGLNIQGANANVSIGSGPISLNETSVSSNASVAFPANTTLANLTLSDGTVQLAGSVTGLADIVAGILNSCGTVGSLEVGVGGVVNTSSGTIGATVSAGVVNSSGGQFSSFDSSGDTSLTGGSVSGTTNITAGTFSTIPFATLSGTVNVSGGSATFGGTQSGALNVSGGSANVTTTGTVGGLTTVSAGNLTTNGTLSGGLATTGGTVYTYSTGTSTGSNLTLGTGSTLSASGSSVTNYGCISSSSVSINNATLALDPSFTLANESAFTIISNTGGSAVSGIFNGLPEGSRITAGSNNLTISYQGGPGRNDVVLYRTGGLSTMVTTTTDTIDPNDNVVSLREAVTYARLNAATTGADQTVSFSLSYPATITLNSGADYGVIGVNQNSTLAIAGPAVNTGNSVTVSGGGVTGIFSLATATNLSNLTLSGGSALIGGAIFNNATTSLNALTIQDNTASNGAGLWNDSNGNLTITNSTFANNTATNWGGAILNNFGTINLSQSTIAFNQAGYGAGGIDATGNVNLTNTIVANNTAPLCPDLGVVNASYSLIGNTSGALITGSNNLQNVNALLGTLNYYGGTTKVYPLLPGSPAINSGTGSGVTDQRGVTVAGTADMGSFQSRGFSITNTGGTGQVAMIGDAFPTNLSLSVASAYSEPVDGGVVTFTAPVGNVPSATLAGSTTISGGNVSVQATANAFYGATANQNYNITANASGVAAGTSYQLLNVGTPSTVNITGGNNQSGNITGNFGQTLGINVKDSVGNNIPRLSVTFTPTTITNTPNGTFGALGNVNGAGAGNVYTASTDANGNITGLTYASNGIGGLVRIVANATVPAISGVRPLTTQTNNFTEGAVGLVVQNGTAGRSFVNAVSGLFGSAGLAANLPASQYKIQYLGYSGTETPANVTLANGSASSTNINWSYGANGITGGPNSQTGDGVYQLAVDYNNDGIFETTVKFHRLFGDVNGDKVVDTLDYNAVISPTAFGKFNITSGANTNGVGQVYTKDVTTVLRQRGRRVSYNVY